MKTYKLLPAASKYCAQFDSSLHMLPELLSGVPSKLCCFVRPVRNFPRLLLLSGVNNRVRWICAVWSKFPQFAQVVVVVGSTEKTTLALCSVVKIYAVCAGCSYCREC